MASFESDITNKKFPARPMKNIDIPDESGYTPPGPSPQGQFAPSVTRRYGAPLDEQAILEFNQRMQEQMDPDGGLSDVEREIKQARHQKIHGQQHLTDGAKKRIEMLIGMTRGTRTAEIDGNAYAFQTLKGKEMRQALFAASEFDNTVQSPFEIRKQLLARSLTHIAGVPIEQFVGNTSLDSKLAFVEELPEELLIRLYDEYLIMAKEAKDKYAIKSIVEAKEVVEDLKK